MLQGSAFSHILYCQCDLVSRTVQNPHHLAGPMLRISDSIVIPESEIEINAIRSQGPGGQNVNKVATAIHLRFNIESSAALPNDVKSRLMAIRDHRISSDGIINLKAQRSRSQDKNKMDALNRLCDLIGKALVEPRPRKKTKPSRKAKEKRLADKARRGQLKQSRAKIDE